MNKTGYRRARFATASGVILLLAALGAPGCGGDDTAGISTDSGADGVAVDSGADTTQRTDSAIDTGIPSDSSRGDAPADQSTGDAPADQSMADVPVDTSTVDTSTADTSTTDAPVDSGGCNAATCATGCCSAGMCMMPSATQCGTGGAACMDCGPTADGCTNGSCTCGAGAACGSGQVCSGGTCVCNPTSCPMGCCDANNTCQPGNTPGACGAGGAMCTMCPMGQSCTAGACSGCNAMSCPTGCCSGAMCTMPSATACGTGGAVCVSCGIGADGCSASGTCTCGGGPACGAGQACVGGTCACDMASCPTGCCQGPTCTMPSAMACGTAGATCVNCGSSADGCSATGTCTCGGGAACGAGQVCSGGACVCNATSCANGCCQGNVCQPGNTPGACGSGGGVCATCAPGQDCPAGACMCDANSCSMGCCQNNLCQMGNTTSACGTGGATCVMCPPGDSCTGGMCMAAVCGNGVRETGEQCDDGNTTNLDGCDATCQFEQDTRATQIVVQWAHDTFCTHDALLEAVQDPLGMVHSTIQNTVNTAVMNGTTSVLFKYFGITDLTGQSGTASVASYNAAPVAYAGMFNGNSDLDWWYTLDTTTAGGAPLYLPTAKESPGTFTGGVLNASGGHVLISAFGTSLLDMASVLLRFPITSPATTPAASTGAPPGHLAGEHLDPALTSFGHAGGTNATPTGQICGNTTALSLSQTAVPMQLQTNCTQGYGATNNLLDVFVGGCTATFGVTVINAVQPDQINPDAPPAGAGGLYTFQMTGTHVTGCRDHTGATVTPYTNCLAPAAYSTYFKVAVDRVILKHP